MAPELELLFLVWVEGVGVGEGAESFLGDTVFAGSGVSVGVGEMVAGSFADVISLS